MSTEIINRLWDCIIIGTGIGGGTVGRRLCEAGLNVLFVEFGPNSPSTEEQDGYPNGDWYSRMLHGIWPYDADVETNHRILPNPISIGTGVGGTSNFYASTLERPAIRDINNTEVNSHPTGGWPVSYSEFEDYFSQAETIFHVVGEDDPHSTVTSSKLKAPKPDTDAEKELRQFFLDQGLKPYRSPTGARFLEDCEECFGRKCPRNCKMDGRTAGVYPAMATGKAALLDWCEAIRFHGSHHEVECLEARHKDETIYLKARIFILSAGALNSPRILQRSASDYWPRGCANSSGLVGRNLMFHLSEFFAIWPNYSRSELKTGKSFSMRDFYEIESNRLGILQALGVNADYRTISYFLNAYSKTVERSALYYPTSILQLAAKVSAKLLGNAEIYVGILEDLPNNENRVDSSPDFTERIKITYNFSDELRFRRTIFRRSVLSRLPTWRAIHLNRSPQINFAHACGTICFGGNAAKSVLDRNCRSHDVQNLYCVDSSFMPTSNGVNPSLTIAANALRVADQIVLSISNQV